MKFIRQKLDIVYITTDPYRKIELAARNCYNTEDKISQDTDKKMIVSLIKSKHHSMIEFADLHVKFTTDRTTSHELVRHRLASFAQSSQRYINYFPDGITYILPPWMEDRFLGDWGSPVNKSNGNIIEKFLEEPETFDVSRDDPEYDFLSSMYQAELAYMKLIGKGWSPEKARKVLPGSTATTIHMKANFREWMHVLNLRYHGSTGRPDPTMKDLMEPLYGFLSKLYPEIFA